MKTSELDFCYFQDRVDRWAERLGLGDWDIRCAHTECVEVLAEVSINPVGRVASVALSTDWGDLDEITRDTLDKTARHEVLHVVLADLVRYAENRTQDEELRDTIEHAIVRRLEKALR